MLTTLLAPFQVGQVQNATLCYIVATNVEKTIAYWVREAENAATVVGLPSALQAMVEKSQLFRECVRKTHAGAVAASAAAGNDVSTAGDQPDALAAQPEAKLLGVYAELLADQGLLDAAIRYAKQIKDSDSALLHRLHVARVSCVSVEHLACASRFVVHRLSSRRTHPKSPRRSLSCAPKSCPRLLSLLHRHHHQATWVQARPWLAAVEALTLR